MIKTILPRLFAFDIEWIPDPEAARRLYGVDISTQQGIENAFHKLWAEGGATEDPTYQDVCTDSTGHAEVVQVTYDPAEISYEQLLDVYWASHNPTTLNRQGPDVGTQYRSAIFFHNPEQEAAAAASKNALEEKGAFKRPIVTEIVPASTFYRAEEYHQQYLEKRGLSECHI